MGKAFNTIMGILEGMSEVAIRLYEQKKDDSEARVRRMTNIETSKAYRNLLDAMETLTSTEKEFVEEELRQMIGSVKKQETVVVEKPVIVSDNPDEGWETDEIEKFDYEYGYAKRLNKENIAQYIKREAGYKLAEKSLVDIQKRVNYYKSIGL